eukprot:16395001-Heterocapsa_arctica.AAC.1
MPRRDGRSGDVPCLLRDCAAHAACAEVAASIIMTARWAETPALCSPPGAALGRRSGREGVLEGLPDHVS